MRKHFSTYLEEMATRHEDILFVTGDLGYNALENLVEKMGDRFINAGVAEQNMIGVAAGMASQGYRVICYSIAPFVVYRCLEQIRNDVCFHNLPVYMVGNGGGYGYGIMGSSHHCIEDIACLSGLPNMRCYVPAFVDDMKSCMDEMFSRRGPAYLRLGLGKPMPQDMTAEAYGAAGRRGDKLTIIAQSPVANNVVAAVDAHAAKSDISVFTINKMPLAELPADIAASIAASGRVLTVEEHISTGGLGAAVSLAVNEAQIPVQAYVSLHAEGYPTSSKAALMQPASHKPLTDCYYPMLNNTTEEKIRSLKGPIFVFGAGGFIGVNLFNTIFRYRKDVYAITQDPRNNWRFIVNDIPAENIVSCDINDIIILKDTLAEYKPRTIFNLAAYGAYSKQREYKKIYATNFNSGVNIIELLKEPGFDAYIQAGSSSEYGLNSAAPKETDELIPNSHYAVSKVAAYYANKYYGKIEQLPVAHLRLYSAYGAWEEPDRLIPVLIAAARKGKYPPLVDPDISRDFIDVADVCEAFVHTACEIGNIKGEALNIGTGLKTTIRELTQLMMQQYGIPEPPSFGNMPNRNWDMADWYSDSGLAGNLIGWQARIKLADGLRAVDGWQEQVNFDTAFWNWNK